MDGHHHDDDHMEMGVHLDPFHGQLAYTMVSTMSVAHLALEIFKWHHLDTYDTDEWKDSQQGTNYYLYNRQITYYGGLAIWSVLAVTQMLSNFGIMTDINLMAWTFGGMIGGLLMLVANIIGLYGYEKMYTVENDTNALAANRNNASLNRATVESDMTKDLAIETAHAFELYIESKSWYYAQWLGLSDEKKVAMAKENYEKREERRAEKEMDDGEEMFAF
jgi:hypothetical protein